MGKTGTENPSSNGELNPLQTLIEQVKANDPAAWELLYELYSPLIGQYAQSNGVRCPHERENIVQDVFTKLIKSIDSYKNLEGRGSFRAWLCTITRNHVLTERNRKLASVGGSSWQKRIDEIPFPKNSPAQQYDSVWERRQKQLDQKSKAVSKIFEWIDERYKSKDRNKAVLKDLLMDEKSAYEVAQDHNVTTNVIYQIKSRMVAQIREIFDSSGNTVH